MYNRVSDTKFQGETQDMEDMRETDIGAPNFDWG
jgi:hypothetical protein